MDMRIGQGKFHVMGRAWRGITDFLAPPRCLACHQLVSTPAGLCISCWAKLTQIEEPVCDVRGTPFAYDQGELAVSEAARAQPPLWDQARAAVLYDEASRPIIHALKYRDTPEAGLFMARMMARGGRHLLSGSDLLMPVPLHRFRLWRRRFNQSAFLAQKLASLAGKPFRPDILLRVKRTPPQVGLAEAERRRNVKNAFGLHPLKAPEIAGKRVLLIDDVLTTGATADACARVLKAAGAAKVDVLTFALVVQPFRLHI